MKAVLGAPPRCQVCGAYQLAPMFGQVSDEAGRRYPVVNPTVIQCTNCRSTFPTGVPKEEFTRACEEMQAKVRDCPQ